MKYDENVSKGFIKSTARDYDMPESRVLTIYKEAVDGVDYYARLEAYIERRSKKKEIGDDE